MSRGGDCTSPIHSPNIRSTIHGVFLVLFEICPLLFTQRRFTDVDIINSYIKLSLRMQGRDKGWKECELY